MKYETLVIAAFILAYVSAAPQGQKEPPIEIISQESNIEPDGSYQSSYETANGIRSQETGTLKKATSPDSNDVIIVQGENEYTAPDGSVIRTVYTADDVNGYQAKGDHIPTPPPVPEAIQKAVDLLLRLAGTQQ